MKLIGPCLKGEVAGFGQVVRARDIVVSDGVMRGQELRAPKDLLFDDTLHFPMPLTSYTAGFVFDGLCFRLIETNEPLLIATTRIVLMSERADTIAAFTLSPICGMSQEMYVGVPQLFEPQRDYTLIDMSYLASHNHAAQ